MQQVSKFECLVSEATEGMCSMGMKYYNKVEGNIKTRFSKQILTLTMMKIHNVTAKADLKNESQSWIFGIF
jgi:hypothetical protein